MRASTSPLCIAEAGKDLSTFRHAVSESAGRENLEEAGDLWTESSWMELPGIEAPELQLLEFALRSDESAPALFRQITIRAAAQLARKTSSFAFLC